MHRCIFHYFFLIEIGLRIRVLHNVFFFSVRSFIHVLCLNIMARSLR